ncbi:glutamate--tRNA ligase [Gelidibacter maritimus]|uniref:Glutamate--tRNA ligase n=1 Tax=Gelidibacter maritimus TaxID=2761487 RepID=A0A7W2M3E1_9FLAO|nr:glutamate--tRNA ligase [Gelidibacter maritimus]MBA6151957.1 glutamate--tRNA ligase [Gelidibacter maritimus]
MTDQVRVRFAPSPTGPLHIGGVRTALYNYLFAKKHNGSFILRIEDTDQNRYVEGSEQYIIDALNWCQIPFDEGPEHNEKFGPYRQSERKHLYQEYAEKLIASGHAYYAFDTAESLEHQRKNHESKGKTFIYNWHNRKLLLNSLALSKEETQAKLDAGEDYVIRFKSPQDQTLHLKDIIRGEITIDTNILDDKVLFKSDGMPTYHLANIVDDHLMEITHVIRGEEWLPSLALHYQLYDAFGWEKPQFAHLPLLLKPTGKGKLSKRDGDKLGFPVFPLEWKDPQTGDVSRGYREDGYFADGLINFLALLGWNPGTEQEQFSLEELVDAFELERVHKSGARFDPDKIKWFNHQYMQHQNDDELAEIFQENQPQLKAIDPGYIALVIGLIKERATFISDFWDLSSYFFEAPQVYDEKAFAKVMNKDTRELMSELEQVITHVSDFTVKNIQTDVKAWIGKKGVGFGKVMQPLRLALVGAMQGPDVFEIMFLIGKAETVQRIDKLVQTL